EEAVVAAARVLADRRADEVVDALLAGAAARAPAAELFRGAAPAVLAGPCVDLLPRLANTVTADEAVVTLAGVGARLGGCSGAVAPREEKTGEGEGRQEADAHEPDDTGRARRGSRRSLSPPVRREEIHGAGDQPVEQHAGPDALAPQGEEAEHQPGDQRPEGLGLRLAEVHDHEGDGRDQ